MATTSRYRTVIQEIEFETAFRHACGAARHDEALRSLEWLLARNPMAGLQLDSEQHIWALAFSPSNEHGTFIVLYTFQDSEVVLQSVKEHSIEI